MRNRLAFSYPDATAPSTVDSKQFPLLEAPFKVAGSTSPTPQPGTYSYRVTKQHMPKDGTLKPGDTATATISLEPHLYDDGFLDVGFTRGYASSQAFTGEVRQYTQILFSLKTSGWRRRPYFQ